MAMYNTRGSGHREERMDFDTMYNKGYVWPEVLTMVVLGALKHARKLNIARHVQERISSDNAGNRLFAPEDITLDMLRAGEPVEAEFALDYYEEQDVEMLRKAVIRLPERNDGEQVCVVVAFSSHGAPFVRTAWLNKVNDTHQKGLDMDEFDWEVDNTMFGFYHGKGFSEVWLHEGNNDTKMESNVVITAEEYDLRHAELD